MSKLPSTVSELLNGEDPLSVESLHLLLEHGEEDCHLDYKLEFHPEQDKYWVELAKDIAAFANADGGYIVFGVKDGDFSLKGVFHQAKMALSDANLVQQKVGRHLDPDQIGIRCKAQETGGKSFVALYIPPSRHVCVFKKDGEFALPSGKMRVAFRAGTVAYRRSAGNRLADSRDFEAILERRIQSFKEQVLGKIAQVVEAPSDTHVLIVDAKDSGEVAKEFVISDAPDAIAVKGMSFSVAPSSPEQEVAAWIAMSVREEKTIPAAELLWRWYERRKDLQVTTEQKLRGCPSPCEI